MTLKFYYGTETDSNGDPLYTGQSFTTATEGLQLIRDNLIGAGWFVELDDIDPNLVLKMKGFDEDQDSPKDECFIQFYSDTTEQIKCKMYFLDDTSTLQESPIKIFNFYDGQDNRLYMTCDSGSGVLLIQRANFITDGLMQKPANEQPHPSLKAIHFGFLERITFDDKSAIALGEPDFRLHNCFMQKTYFESEIWENVHRTWYSDGSYWDDRDWGIFGEEDYSGINYTKPSSFPSHTTTDFVICTYGNERYNFGFGYSGSRNATYMNWKGQVNAVTGLPLFNRFGYIEGRGRGNIYGNNMGSRSDLPYSYAFRGWVKFVATGMASLLPLRQIKEPNGDRWISAGTAGYQGILIDQTS